MRRPLILAAVLPLVAACAGRGTAAGVSEGAFPDRARVVADAWRTALEGPDGRGWRAGFVPLQDPTVPPAAGFTPDTSIAFSSGWFDSEVTLPDDPPAAGSIAFPDGATLPVPLVSARSAYAAMQRGTPPCRQHPDPVPTPAPSDGGPAGSAGAPAEHTCATLTITGGTLGTTTVRTSRGPASVPAWLFTVAELPAPVARVAVSPEAVSPLPQLTVAPIDPGGLRLAPALRLTGAAEARLSYTIGIGPCDPDPTGVVHETAEAVVIAGTSGEPTDGPCSGALALHPVSVTLATPLGARVVLDAVTGRPLTLVPTP